MVRRRSFLAGAALLPAAPALAQRSPRGLWFDPTQLPSYSGTLSRWLMNPAGETDRALLREGVQIVFSPSEAPDLMAAVQPGQNLTAWGIRARSAPVVTMLAWGRASDQPATFVTTPAWFANMASGRQELEVGGVIQHPLLNPQGEPMGVILENGDVIRLTPAAHQALANRLDNGRRIAAQGMGTRRDDHTSLDAARIGPALDSLAPVPTP
ncbi:MAG: hypothetical protein K2X11_05785 [Acetobacteraceae bacterium]|nr:hypothetical protein [Acetobacteraceae bacterium]